MVKVWTRAKVNVTLNYVDSGQNSGQLMDFAFFLKNVIFNSQLCWISWLGLVKSWLHQNSSHDVK